MSDWYVNDDFEANRQIAATGVAAGWRDLTQ
jgi:hypothetical protein